MVYYAVIDTNVLVSAFISKHQDSPVVKIFDLIEQGIITPVYNTEILNEYIDVLCRPKFQIPITIVEKVVSTIADCGLNSERVKTQEPFTDKKDIVFYEVAISKDGTYLVTGNKKHFPSKPIIVSPSEMVQIIEGNPYKRNNNPNKII